MLATAARLHLYLANYNYSAWSMAAWMTLRLTPWHVHTTVLHMDTPEWAATVPTVSPTTQRLPTLHVHGGSDVEPPVIITDSLAILETAAEECPAVLPATARDRALARSVLADLHCNYVALRAHLPFNVVRRGGLPAALPPAVLADVAQLSARCALWCDAAGWDGTSVGMLDGRVTAVDAFVAPMALRLQSYGVVLPDGVAEAYATTLRTACPLVTEWAQAAAAEGVPCAKYDV